MKLLDLTPSFRDDRYSTRVVLDVPAVRIVICDMLQGQVIPPHRSASSVLLQVLEGDGLFRGDDDAATKLGAGGSAFFGEGEMHSIEASSATLRFMVILTPRPA